MIKRLLPLFGWFFVFVAFFWFPCLPAWFIMKLDERAQVGPTCARLCEPQNPAEPWWYWNGGSKSNGLDISQVDSRNSKNGKMFLSVHINARISRLRKVIGTPSDFIQTFRVSWLSSSNFTRQAFWRVLKSLQTWGGQRLAESFWTRERAPGQSLLGERRCPTRGSDTFSDCFVLLPWCSVACGRSNLCQPCPWS